MLQILLAVLVITSYSIHYTKLYDIDALVTGSQKALMLPPGLAMIGLSSAAVAKIGSGKDYYFNLASEIKIV